MIERVNKLKNEISNLSKALAVLLYDQYDCPDVDCETDEETFVKYIIQALIEKNENVCPFKNYTCVGTCKTSVEKCEEGIRIDCGRKVEGIWKEFIRIEGSEGE
ncbi:hypothetical protein HYG84_19955 (plasmid) [Alkaliphilus sp. B6464]|nr:hypothetical protein HYG84_19955 [Alkaliphilus sp. B6464]